MLEQIDAFLLSGASLTTVEYAIKDRSRKYQTLEDLLAARAYYAMLVNREERLASGLSRNSYVRFVRA
jgi:hypothetical protein